MNRFFMIIIVLLPFLVQIKSPIHFISLGELLLIPLMIIRTINIKGKIKIDKIFLVNDEDAINMSRKIALNLGIGVGISSGANMIASILAKEENDKNIVYSFRQTY